MATDARRRQKKLQRRRAKEKAKRRLIARERSLGFGQRLAHAGSAPIIHCAMNSDLWQLGMGEVLISRRLPDGNVAVSLFLVDTLCLGVKDVVARILPEAEYRYELYEGLTERMSLTKIEPEYARKLVEEAVEYAAQWGLSPHPDYHKAKHIFGDIDAGACTEQFIFGKDGKPFYSAGPFDTPEKVRRIIGILSTHGQDAFHFIVPLHLFPYLKDGSIEYIGDDEDDEED